MQAPSTRTADQWPPDYVSVFQWRQQQALRLIKKPELAVGAKEYYRARPADFINHWCFTYDPRNAGQEMPTKLPFILFPRQAEMVDFLRACMTDEECGLIEKARDMGATWVCCAFSVHQWLFEPGVSVGWGSRKEQLVDKIGDPDSIFEKMRMIVRNLPPFFMPRGFSPSDHMTYMKIINPENGATITGEAGDNIGRGGRKRIYFKDESAHYERPEKIEAALADNTRVQIDISSVNGTGNVFHRRREAGLEWASGSDIPPGRTRVFVMDWRDHPAKTQTWYDRRKAKARDDGLSHVFAQEVDRNYSAAVQGVVIPPEWVDAAVDAHIKLNFGDDGGWCAGLDVADGGADRNAFAARRGVVLRMVDEWGERDTALTARKAVGYCTLLAPVDLQYDCIGVGAGVKSETNRLADEGLLPKGVTLVPWNAAAAVLKPEENVEPGDKDSPKNKDFYGNFKAQAWWNVRRRFEKTWRAVNDPSFTWRADELISLDSSMPMIRQVRKELSQATAGQGASMKLIINKTPEGTRSPNLADAIVQAYYPAPRAGSRYTLDNV